MTMVDPEIYIKEGLKIVDTYISQGNLQAALSGCRELLKINPYHRKLQKTLTDIEAQIVKQNQKKVDQDIKSTMHLWDEGRYDDLMKIYHKLYEYAPQHKHLRQLIEKLNAKLTETNKDQREAVIQKALIVISDLMRQKRFDEVVSACGEYLSYDPLNETVRDYLKKARERKISAELEKNARIVDSVDFERALELYENLIKIDPENEKLKELALQAKAHLAEKESLAGKIHFNESVARMKELFKTSEYEKVMQACEEIDRLDPGNFTAKLFKRKAEHTMRSESDQMMLKILKEARPKTAEEYAKNPAGFVRI